MLNQDYDNFLFYGSFLKTIESIPDIALQNKVMLSIIKYGCCGEMPSAVDEPMVYAFMQLVIPNIKQQKKNYEKKNGGRPSVSPTQNTFNKIFEEGELTSQEIADLLGVSLSTVDRRKKAWREAKELEDNSGKVTNIKNIYFNNSEVV